MVCNAKAAPKVNPDSSYNAHNVNKNKFDAANNNPNSWTKGEIGTSREIAKLKLQGLEQTNKENTLTDPDHQKNQIKDIPEEDMKSLKSQEKGVVDDSKFVPMDGMSEPKGAKPAVGKGMSKVSAVLDLIDFGATQLTQYHYNDDMQKIKAHTKLAQAALENLNSALRDGLVPAKFKNEKDLSDLANVILQGQSNQGNKELEALGLKIYDTYKPKVFTSQSGLDNYQGIKLTIPLTDKGSKKSDKDKP